MQLTDNNFILILGNDGCHIAGTTVRGVDNNSTGPYDGFSLCGYTGDDATHVADCRQRLADALGVRTIFMPRQVHGTETLLITDPDHLPSPDTEADAVVTNLRDIAIGVNTADCVPVIMVDTEAGIAAAVHAGWRGAVAGIVGKAFEKMVSLGAKAKHTSAYIAPCIHECCFEVGEEVAEQFPDIAVNRTGYAKPHVNLPAFVESQLTAMGIADVTTHPDCTRCNPDRYFSARAHGIRSGRNFTFAKL